MRHWCKRAETLWNQPSLSWMIDQNSFLSCTAISFVQLPRISRLDWRVDATWPSVRSEAPRARLLWRVHPSHSLASPLPSEPPVTASLAQSSLSEGGANATAAMDAEAAAVRGADALGGSGTKAAYPAASRLADHKPSAQTLELPMEVFRVLHAELQRVREYMVSAADTDQGTS